MALLLLVIAVMDRNGHHRHLGVVLAVNPVSQIGGSLLIYYLMEVAICAVFER
ncbi:hypothetical protein PENNAL_c0407G06789 [Penicillium nalgiovense]|uniref:Uncharacterized protein n=2 Tax=Penicillium nalgiovense TaxID=60175 RepID=A0A1V6W1E7_PENNA|nr:hypothetical protein PENNAL_c0407G06789 [Penicillium nalgiovense]